MFDGMLYGFVFFMVIGFYGVYVVIGMIFLMVCLFWFYVKNMIVKKYFGFEFVVWYWYFVDVVWLFLFVFVYVLLYLILGY